MTDQSIASVVLIRDYRNRRKLTAFSRPELNLLISVYSRRVISGEWKAYALDHGEAAAKFSIFTNAHAQPVYTVTKLANPSRRRKRFTICQGVRKVAEADVLKDALAYFRKNLRLVSG